jgi:hypothetical protein
MRAFEDLTLLHAFVCIVERKYFGWHAEYQGFREGRIAQRCGKQTRARHPRGHFSRSVSGRPLVLNYSLPKFFLGYLRSEALLLRFESNC